MKFSDFLNESVKPLDEAKAEVGNIKLLDSKDAIAGKNGFEENDLVVIDDDLEVDTSLKTVKFDIAAVAHEGEDPVAYEVVAATVEVEFSFSKDEGAFTVDSSDKIVSKDIWETDEHDAKTYDNLEATQKRFKRLLTDSAIKQAAQLVLDKNIDYVKKELTKYEENNF